MKKIIFFLFLFINTLAYQSFSQTLKVAILDFENVSGKTEYDALGKALSEMLITDLQNNIHPKKVEFFERTQLNRLLDEQKLQKSKNFDGNTAVVFGKLSGVNYVLVGSVFILDGNLNINSKLVDVETSEIILSKAANGKMETFLQLKSQLAESIAQKLNNPFTIDPTYKNVEVTVSTINQFSKLLSLIDQGDFDKAEQLRNVFEETNPSFKYFSDLNDEINQLKKQVSEMQNVADVLTDEFELGNKAEEKSDYKSAIKYFERYLINSGDKGYAENKKLNAYLKLSISHYKLGDYSNALKFAQNASKIYTFYPKSNEVELLAFIKLNRKEEAMLKYNFIIDSLTFNNEVKFRSQKVNDELKWELLESVYYGLPTEKNGNDWCYLGIRQCGYGDSPVNEVTIKAFLSAEKIDLNFFDKELSQYEKIEKKLLELKDPRVFSSQQILNFYFLSLDFSMKLYTQKDFDSYKKHLEKEIGRMEGFGIPCKECWQTNQRRSIPHSYGPQEVREFDKIHQTIRDIGLSNSIQAFYDQFPLIYGKFIFNYLIYLIKESSFSDAAQLYKSLLKPLVTKRDSYFYNYYWDVLLGLREMSGDLNSRQNLSSEEQARKLNKKIEDQLKKENIALINFEKVKNVKIKVDAGDNNIEIDDEIISDNMIWSKNIRLVKDGDGSTFQLATEKRKVWELNRDSIPTYCFYDFEEQNGLKFGYLYNYWAMKLLAHNPPSGWRLARQSDFSKYLKIDSLLERQNKVKNPYQEAIYTYNDFLQIYQFKKEDLPFLRSGHWYGNGFLGINTQANFWTDESTSNDPRYQKVVDFFSDGRIRFSDINCKDCLFSIRLIKSR